MNCPEHVVVCAEGCADATQEIQNAIDAARINADHGWACCSVYFSPKYYVIRRTVWCSTIGEPNDR